MVLAEALLRVPDAATADRLIEDKLATGELGHRGAEVGRASWSRPRPGRSASPPAIIQPGETPETILDGLLKRLGLPAVRTATRQAMRLLGSHFVLGQTIEEALRRAGAHPEARYSFDMLGEGARTAADARRYLEAYAAAIDAIGASAGDGRACPTAPAFRSSCPRCIRASRRCRASAYSRSWCRTCWRWRARRAAMTSISPSMPRRPIGWN